MKKVVSLLLVVALAFTFSVGSFAASPTDANLSSEISSARANNSILVTDNSVYDFRKISSKSFHPAALNNTYSINSTSATETEKTFFAAGSHTCSI